MGVSVAVLTGVCTVFFDVAYQSYLPHLVGRDHLVEGNAKLEVVRASNQIGGPTVAGLLIQWLTAPFAVAVDAVSYLGSAVFVARIHKREEKPERAPDAHLGREIMEGLDGRVIVATFASNIARIQQVFDAAKTFDRQVAVVGRSMEQNTRIATDLGYLSFDPRRYGDLGTSLVIPLLALALGGIGFPGGAVYLRNDLMRSPFWRAAASTSLGPASGRSGRFSRN